MKTVSFDVDSSAKASRVELFVRILWCMVSYIVLLVFGMVAGLCLILEWLVILFTGKRNASLNNIIKMYVLYCVRLYAYALTLTEERSPIIPVG